MENDVEVHKASKTILSSHEFLATGRVKQSVFSTHRLNCTKFEWLYPNEPLKFSCALTNEERHEQNHKIAGYAILGP